MSKGTENVDSVASSLEQLRHLVGVVNKSDLSGLAKMHGLCEALIECASAQTTEGGSPICEPATKLGKTIESLILGEAEDPDGAIVSLSQRVADVEQAAGSSGSGEVAETGASELSDEQVAAKLEQIFDDTSPSSDKPEPVQPDASPVGETKAPSEAPVAEGVTGASGDDASAAQTEPPYDQEPLVLKESEAEFVKGFVEEAYEHIEAIESALLDVERAADDAGKIDTLFRPFHTIKGMAGFLNLRDINCLTHEAETLLDQGRKGNRTITPGMIDLIFDVVDILKVQISAVGGWLKEPNDKVISQPPVVQMIGHLRAVVAGKLEPASIDPEKGGPDQKVGENLVEQGACPSEVVDFALEAQKAGAAGKKTGAILIDAGTVTPKQVSQALRAQNPPSQNATKQGGAGGIGDQSVRIDTAKLDALVDMVGEMVIAQTQVSSDPMIAGDEKLTKNVSQVTKIVRDVQETAMAMRMVPIGPATFQKMARLVRDVSRKAGKQVDLSISGEETELDKNVIQQINDPLVHMVRNAVDHGIESSEDRARTGKPQVGHVHLGAFHQGGDIVIEISDDGKGLDAAALIAKGIEKGIVQPGEQLSDQQAFGLIFAPGFSMAKQVTDISGRGVGMDVVRRNIEQLRGKIDITSEVGKGSTFAIRLPLTLAIIDGMIVRVGTERLIIQTIVCEQSLRPQRSQITTVQQKGEVLNVRGRLIPLIQLGELLGLTKRIDPCEAMVVIAQCDRGQIGLVVEELLGQQQVVIKSLGERFEKLRGISGAAILGDGKVGLILEISGLAAAHNDQIAQSRTTDSVENGTAGKREPSVEAQCVAEEICESEEILAPA